MENSWEKRPQLSDVLSEFVIFLKLGVLWWKLKISIAIFHRTDFGGFLVCC